MWIRETRKSIGSPSWARTSDLRINSPSLYQLSYRGTTCNYIGASEVGSNLPRLETVTGVGPLAQQRKPTLRDSRPASDATLSLMSAGVRANAQRPEIRELTSGAQDQR